MATLTLDDELIQQVIAKSRTQNAREAVIQVLSNYLQEKEKPNINTMKIVELLAMPEVANIDFEPPRLTSPLYHEADLS